MNESVLWDSAILLIITSNSKKSDVKRTTGSLMVACKGKVREVHKPGYVFPLDVADRHVV